MTLVKGFTQRFLAYVIANSMLKVEEDSEGGWVVYPPETKGGDTLEGGRVYVTDAQLFESHDYISAKGNHFYAGMNSEEATMSMLLTSMWEIVATDRRPEPREFMVEEVALLYLPATGIADWE